MKLDLTIPDGWTAGGSGIWRTGDLVVTVSPLSAQPTVLTATSAATAVKQHRALDREIAIDRSGHFATTLGWPATWFIARLRGGGATTHHRFAVCYDMLEHFAIAAADATDLETLERRRSEIETTFASARPHWSGVGGISQIFTGIDHV